MSAALRAVPLDESACSVCGRESCEGTHADLAEFEASRAGPRFRSAADVMADPPPAQVVEGVVQAGGVSVLVGPSGAGKTFTTSSIAAAVSDGVPWHGRAVQQGSVAYLVYEADAMSSRLRALQQRQGARLEDVYFLAMSAPLSPIVDRDRLELPSPGELVAASALGTLRDDLAATRRPPIRLVMVDTTRLAMSGSEDSSENVAAWLRAYRRLLALLPGAGGLTTHHAGWQDGEAPRKRERGSSAFRGNVEASLYLEACDHEPGAEAVPLVLRTLKLRDLDRPAPLHLLRRRVDITDALGQPATSCIIESDPMTAADRAAEQQAEAERACRQVDRKVLEVIRDRAVTSQRQLRAFAGLRSDAVADALARVLAAGWAEQDRQRQPYQLTTAGRAALQEAE